MNGTSSVYIEQMYECWKNDRSSVHKSWDIFFSNVETGAQPGYAYQVTVFLLKSLFIFGVAYLRGATGDHNHNSGKVKEKNSLQN